MRIAQTDDTVCNNSVRSILRSLRILSINTQSLFRPIRGIPSEAKIRDLQALQTSVDKHQTDEDGECLHTCVGYQEIEKPYAGMRIGGAIRELSAL